MQMYRIEFQTRYDGVIDTGSAVVCAGDEDAAAAMLVWHLGLPVSMTVLDVKKLKPAVFNISRKEIIIPQRRAASGGPKNEPELAVYAVAVSAEVKAISEASAFRILAKSVTERASANAPETSGKISDLEMRVERRELRARTPALEKQSIYTHPQFFRGGSARGG